MPVDHETTLSFLHARMPGRTSSLVRHGFPLDACGNDDSIKLSCPNVVIGHPVDSRWKHAGMTAGAPHALTFESPCKTRSLDMNQPMGPHHVVDFPVERRAMPGLN